MDFVKKEWQFRDIISENELNRMEDGIEEGITKAEQAQSDISAHVARTDNPHGVTKDQVGLGNVQNYPVASQSEAEAGTASNRYMTPQRTKQAVDALSPVKSVNGKTGVVTLAASDVGAAPFSHVGAGGSAHAVATSSDAGFMSSTDKVKLDGATSAATPNALVQRDSAGRFKAASPSASDDVARKAEVDAHASRTDNPHNVTKSQVGLGNVDNVKQATKTEFDAHVADNARHNTRTTFTATTPGTSYPNGLSYQEATTANGWPSIGTVITVKDGDNRCYQIAVDNGSVASPLARYRAYHTSTGWTAWDVLITSRGGTMTGDLFIQSNWPAVWLVDTDINDKISILHDNSSFYVQLRDAAGNWIRDLLKLSNNGAEAQLGTNNIWHAGNLQYEEGTWTPELMFGSSSTGITYGSRYGRYTRIGNVVFWELDIRISSKGTASGAARINGLPFASNSSLLDVYTVGAFANITLPSNATGMAYIVPGANSSHITLRQIGNGLPPTEFFSDSHFTNNSFLRAQGKYTI